MSKLLSAIIVDDDKDLVDTFSEYLRLHDVKVLGCGYDGKNAVDLYTYHKPDLVFLDLSMPIFDGIYALENIRTINPDAAVVIITSYIRDEYEEKLNTLNPTAVLIKPADDNKLFKIIDYIRKEKYKNIESSDSNHLSTECCFNTD